MSRSDSMLSLDHCNNLNIMPHVIEESASASVSIEPDTASTASFSLFPASISVSHHTAKVFAISAWFLIFISSSESALRKRLISPSTISRFANPSNKRFSNKSDWSRRRSTYSSASSRSFGFSAIWMLSVRYKNIAFATLPRLPGAPMQFHH